MPVGGDQKITVTIAASAPKTYEATQMAVSVRGAKMLRLPMQAVAVVPEVTLEAPEALDFGDLVIGASDLIPCTLTNNGTIAATMVLDLSGHDEFDIEAVSVELGNVDTLAAPPPPQGGKKGGGSHEHEAPAESVMEPTEEHADGTHSSTWNIEAQPGATIRFSLGYTLMSPTSHAFDLPLRFSSSRTRRPT